MTKEIFEALVEQWHLMSEDGKPIYEFMGLTWEEYVKCVSGEFDEC